MTRTYDDLCRRAVAWHEARFPDAKPEHVALKVAEEAGEVASAVLGEVGTMSATGGGDVLAEAADVVIALMVLAARWPRVDLSYSDGGLLGAIDAKLTEMEDHGSMHRASLSKATAERMTNADFEALMPVEGVPYWRDTGSGFVPPPLHVLAVDARPGWNDRVDLYTSMEALLFVPSGDRPYTKPWSDLRVEYLANEGREGGLFKFTLKLGMHVVGGTLCSARSAHKVLDSFLVQLVGGDLPETQGT